MSAGSGASRTVEQRIAAERAAVRLDSAFACLESIGNSFRRQGIGVPRAIPHSRWLIASVTTSLPWNARGSATCTGATCSETVAEAWQTIARTHSQHDPFQSYLLNITEALLRRGGSARQKPRAAVQNSGRILTSRLLCSRTSAERRPQVRRRRSTVARQQWHEIDPEPQGSLSLARDRPRRRFRFDFAKSFFSERPKSSIPAIRGRGPACRSVGVVGARLMADQFDSIHASIAAAAARFRLRRRPQPRAGA